MRFDEEAIRPQRHPRRTSVDSRQHADTNWRQEKEKLRLRVVAAEAAYRLPQSPRPSDAGSGVSKYTAMKALSRGCDGKERALQTALGLVARWDLHRAGISCDDWERDDVCFIDLDEPNEDDLADHSDYRQE